MHKLPVIVIFDAGKTNKKVIVFDEQYQIVFQQSFRLSESADEDGFPCEDIQLLSAWVRDSMNLMMQKEEWEIRAVNFTSYGASLVHLDRKGEPLAPLYNYLKPFPQEIGDEFYSKYGGETQFSLCTASPVLGNLNSGLQLYRLKRENPHLFERIHQSLHLPQFLSTLVSGRRFSDITSIGCHTGLWDFGKNNYHDWVYRENIFPLLAEIYPSDGVLVCNWNHRILVAGAGLHDSSAALIPYHWMQTGPFILLSTGTWCISLNPFNSTPLRPEELAKDCLCYLGYQGKPVKASRFLLGPEHEAQVKRLSLHFGKPLDYYRSVKFDPAIFRSLSRGPREAGRNPKSAGKEIPPFSSLSLSSFDAFEGAYHQLVKDLVDQQIHSTLLVMQGGGAGPILVDGGFSQNSVFMQSLAMAFPEVPVFAAGISEGSALGAAIAIHAHWNSMPLPACLIQWKPYHPKPEERT
jgi:L-fuculokinase